MRILSSIACAGLLLAPCPSAAQSADQVLVVVNTASAASQAIAEAYVAARQVPAAHVVTLDVPVSDDITRADYLRLVEGPIAKAIARGRLHDQVNYLVLTKDVPLRIAGTSGRLGTIGSVDSELALLYRKMSGRPTPPDGRIDNPYFLGSAPLATAKPFSHADHDIYLVTRLDAFSVDDARALVTRGLAARDAGMVVLDLKAGLDDIGNRWLDEAAARLGALGLGDRVRVERSSEVVRDADGLIGYASWGSSDPAITVRRLGLGFVPGALASSFVSTDARTMTAPPDTWTVGDWNNRQAFYAGSPQSLLGDMIAQGVTGAAGNVAEPLLDGVVRPQVLFPAWFSGFTLGEVFYLAMPFLGWQGVVVGDPLSRLVPATRLPAGAAPSLDAATELPAWFAGRRLQAIRATDAEGAAARAFLKAESRLARDDVSGAREALEETVRLAPRSVIAQQQLGGLYERERRWDDAIACYRAILDVQPRDVVALNNLAYALAEHKQRPGDALPYAERAQALAPREGSVADTLALTYHLLGRTADAVRFSNLAASLAPSNAEVALNRAAILLANGDKRGAQAALDAALKLDPALELQAKAVAIRAGLAR